MTIPVDLDQFPQEVRIEQHGTEVHIVMVCSTVAHADRLSDTLVEQLAQERSITFRLVVP